MFFALIVTLTVISLYSDFRIWRMYIFGKSKIWSSLWKFQSGFFITFLLFQFVSSFFVDPRTTVWFIFMMWANWVIILQAGLKLCLLLAVLKHHSVTWRVVSVVLALLFLFVMLYGNFVTRKNLVVTRVDITSEDIPDSFDGYRIAQFSDVHMGTMWLDNHLLERTIDSINSLKPDIVVQSGDIVNIHVNEMTQNRIEQLKGITSPVFAVMGNHDLGFYLTDTLDETPRVAVDSLIRVQRNQLKWTVLDNEFIRLYKGNDSIVLAGVCNPNNLALHYKNTTCGGSDISKAMKGVKQSDFAILISHTPQLIDSLPEQSQCVDLMLSGHTHAMQFKIFGYSPRFKYRESSGLYNKNGVTLYVNGGIGTVGIPFRFGADPEITLFTLRKQ